MKKWMIGLFFSILLLPNIAGLAVGEKEASNTENRDLARWPEFSWETIDEFPSGVESFINDNAPLRSIWLDAYASLNMELFGSIDNKEVIVGKDHWLFYTGNESVIDALGIGFFSDEDLQMILDKLLAVREKYAEDKEDFVLLVAPNKEIVYSQYMPEHYGPLSETSRAKQLVEYIRANSDIKVVYPLEELKAASEEELIYYKTDTHWNKLGGFIGAQALIAAAGGTPADYHDLALSYEGGQRGDLGDLGHTPMKYLEETEVLIHGYLEGLSVEMLENDDGGTGLIRTRTPDSPDERSLTMVRDSFGAAMEPVLPRYFREVVLINWKFMDNIDVAGFGGDVFVYEIVERNLGRLPGDLDVLLAK